MLKQKLGITDDRPVVMVGAGLNKNFDHPDELRRYSEAADAVVVGSLTLGRHPGNEGVLDYIGPISTLNAYGMPNPGIDSLRVLPAHDNLIVSVAGFTVEQYRDLYDWAWSWGLGVEFNFGCPNTGSDKRIFSFDPDAMEQVLGYASNEKWKRTDDDLGKLIGVKLSPYSDPYMLGEVADMLCALHETVDYVVNCNTFPAAKARGADGKPVIRCSITQDRGGMGGQALRDISLGQVAQFIDIFRVNGADIDVLRCGGITSGRDVLDSEYEGCTGVQIVSAVAGRPERLADIMQSYVELKVA